MKVELNAIKTEIILYLRNTSAKQPADVIVDYILEQGFLSICEYDLPWYRKIYVALAKKPNEISTYINGLRSKGHKRAIEVYKQPMVSESLLQGIRIEKMKESNEQE